MRRAHKRSACALMALAMAWGFFVISGGYRDARAGACSEIVVGAVLSLTGEHSAGGNQIRNGYEFAIAQINARGGIRLSGRCHNLRIIYNDDESDTTRAAKLAERLIRRDNVRVLLGPYGLDRTAAVAAVAERHQVPVVAIEGARTAAAAEKRYLFAIAPAPSNMLAGFIDYAAHLAGAIGREPADLRIAVLSDVMRKDEGARELLRARSRRLGMQLVIDEAFGKNSGELSQLLARIRAERPEVLLVDAHPGAAGGALKALVDMHVEAPVLAMTNCEGARLASGHGAGAEGILCLSSWGSALKRRDKLFGTARTFEKQFIDAALERGQKKAAAPVSAQVAYAASAVRVLASAFERAGTLDHYQVRDALEATDLDTIVGNVRFSDTVGPRAGPTPLLVRQIRKGRYLTVWPPSVATDTYRWPRVPNGPF